MGTRCANNQAEAFAILKALDDAQTEQGNKEDKIVTMYTGSRATMDSLNNADKHTFLTEEIRQEVQAMEIRGWKIGFSWIKAHTGTSGSEFSRQVSKRSIRQNRNTCQLHTEYPKVP